MRKRLLPLAAALVLSSSVTTAEIYRWVDDNGRVHFSDRAPDQKAESVAQTLTPVNITEPEPVQEYGELKPKSRAEEQLEQQALEQQRQHAEAELHECELARRNLKILSGPVTFVREDGSEFDITEDERAQREADLRHAISRLCG